MKLALFDLDHTLIPFDSGMAWTQFLVERGVLPADAVAVYLGHCLGSVAGRLDIHAMHRATVGPLLPHPRSAIDLWCREFETAVAPRLPAASRALVQRHLDAGDLCAIVTATARLVAEPFARLFGVAHLVATETATVDGSPAGELRAEIDGEPCWREHKVTRVQRWLAQGFAPALRLDSFEASWFYSDSAGDLPLLQAVTRAVAVHPDARLRAHAQQQGWPVID